jgi:hypothetical protein
LQDIDGPDPKPHADRRKRGLLVLFDISENSIHALKVINKIWSNFPVSALSLNTSMLDPASSVKIITTYPSLCPAISQEMDFKPEKIDFVILISGDIEPNYDSVRYWWSLASGHCLPVFLTSGVVESAEFEHGKSCLFVSNREESWTVAAQLINGNFSELSLIAAEARRRAYFGSSIQKNISQVLKILTSASSHHCNFNKFLPL